MRDLHAQLVDHSRETFSVRALDGNLVEFGSHAGESLPFLVIATMWRVFCKCAHTVQLVTLQTDQTPGNEARLHSSITFR